MPTTPPTITENPLQGLVAPSGKPLSSGSSDFQKQTEKAMEEWSKWAKTMSESSKSFQADARVLREAGITFEEIEKKMRALGLTGKHLDQAMRGYHRSLKEISNLPLSQLFSDWKVNLMSLSKAALPLASLAVIVKTFQSLDDAGAQLNKTMGSVAIQSGAVVRGFGFGGVVGGIKSPGGVDLEKQVAGTSVYMMRLGYSAQQAGEVMSGIAKSLPSNITTSAAPQFAKAAAAIATTYDMEVGTASEFLINSLRRGATTSDKLYLSFESIRKAANESKLSYEELFKGTNQLWNVTYRYGGTLTEATATMVKYKDALRSQLLTTQDITSMQGQAAEAGPGSIVALATMARTYAPESKTTKLFGSSKDPSEILGAYMRNQAGIVGGQAELIKTIVTSIAKERTGKGASADALLGNIFLIAKSLPQGLGQGLSTAEIRGLGYGGLGAAKIPGISPTAGKDVADSFADVETQAKDLADAFQSITKQVSNFRNMLPTAAIESTRNVGRILGHTAAATGNTVLNFSVNATHDMADIERKTVGKLREAYTQLREKHRVH